MGNCYWRGSLLLTAMLWGGVCSLPTAVAADPVWKMHTIDPKTDQARGADGVRLLDVNGDGLLDVATGWEEARQTRAYLHPGPDKADQPWPRVTVGRDFGAPEDAVFCDLDGDGSVDVVSSCEGNRMYVHWAPKNQEDYLNEAAWTTELFPSGSKHGGMFVVAMQIDGKHGLDLVAGGKGTNLVWFQSPENPRDLSAWKRHSIDSESSNGWTMGIYAADIDQDGDADLVWTTRKGNNGGVRWFANPGPGTAQQQPWKSHKLSAGNADFMFGDVADVNGDGLLDVVAPVRSQTIHFFCNLGNGEWKDVSFPAFHPTNKGAAVGDVNLDGQMDIVVTHLGTPGPSWCEYQGDPADPASWRGHATGAGGGKSDLVALYDVDQDGDLDILTTVETKRYQVVWYENPYSKQVRGAARQAK